MFRATRYAVYLLAMVDVASCSGQSGRELGYEAAKSMGRVQCEQGYTVECPEPIFYREYAQARHEAVPGNSAR